MARLISSDYDEYETHAITHGVMSDSVLRGLTDRARDSLSRTTSRAREYAERAYNALASLDLGSIRDKISAITKRKNDRFDEDFISDLMTPIDLQQAKPSNRRTLMISPVLRSLYADGLIAGYHGQFEDNEPGRVGRDHTQYRELYSGHYVHDEADDDACGFKTYLLDDLVDYDRDELSLNEKAAARANIERAEYLVEKGECDPTNQLGGTL